MWACQPQVSCRKQVVADTYMPADEGPHKQSERHASNCDVWSAPSNIISRTFDLSKTSPGILVTSLPYGAYEYRHNFNELQITGEPCPSYLEQYIQEGHTE